LFYSEIKAFLAHTPCFCQKWHDLKSDVALFPLRRAMSDSDFWFDEKRWLWLIFLLLPGAYTMRVELIDLHFLSIR
jgi:hypothetical protein